MPTSYTSILKLALPVTGELSGTWGDVVNNNITSMIEQAIAGLATINTWTANSHTLTTANGTTAESRCAILVADDDGAGNPSAAATIICPTATKTYVLRNISGQKVTIKTASGTGVIVANGATATVFCDGVNVVPSGVEAVVSLATNSATLTVDITTGGMFVIDGLATNTTISFSGGTSAYDGKKIVLQIKQDATGSRTVAFDTSTGKARFGTDITTFTASTTASKTDYVGVIYNATADKYDIVSYTRGY